MTVDGAKVIVTETEKNLVALGAVDGKLLWQTPFAAQGMAYNAATPIVDGQTLIYAGQGRGTKAVKIDKQGDAFDAKELWSNSENSVQFNTPVLKNGLLFGITQRNEFFCLNSERPDGVDCARSTRRGTRARRIRVDHRCRHRPVGSDS